MLVDNEDKKNVEDTIKATKPKKTLSLGGKVTLEDLNINKEVVKSGGRSGRGAIVEVVGTQRVTNVVMPESKKDVKLDANETVQVVANSDGKRKLTQEEIDIRHKLVENASKNTEEVKNFVAQLSLVVKDSSETPQSVIKENIDTNNINESNIPVDEIAEVVVENNENINAIVDQKEEESVKKKAPYLSSLVLSKLSSRATENEVVKPAKKKVLSEQDKKRNQQTNWRNVDTSVVVQDDEEVEDVVVEKTPKFVYPTKRKNKRNNIRREKVLKTIELSRPIVLQDLAHRLSEKSIFLMKALKKLGISADSETLLDLDTVDVLMGDLGHTLVINDLASIEEEFYNFNDSPSDLTARPPVVTIMGHVDHGKTTLLDTMRKTSVVAKEAGGITQHIGAYQITTSKGQVVTFLDTPGHEAFSQIRSRGSKVTDIVILVVAADDGIKPQTIEAINHARFYNVPMIVAINKIDKPEKDTMRVKTELLQQNLVVEEMGGDILCVEISAKENIGIDQLLETIILQAEMLDIKTNNKALGKGSVIEFRNEKGFGVLATVLIERGQLKVGDFFVCGTTMGKIKVMINDKNERLKIAGASMPVEISGFSSGINVGDDFLVVPNEVKAQALVAYRLEKAQASESQKQDDFDLDSFLKQGISEVKTLSLVIKADVQGSLEAILGSLKKLNYQDVEVKVLHSAVGEINESDVNLAQVSDSLVLGFNVSANSGAKNLIKSDKVDVRYHSIIYKLIDEVNLSLGGLLDPDIVENVIGHAEIREVFSVGKVGNIGGCYVTDGVLKRSALVRILRKNKIIYTGVLSQLKRFKDDAKEVKHSFECGVSFDGYNDIIVGDIIECYEKEAVKQHLQAKKDM